MTTKYFPKTGSDGFYNAIGSEEITFYASKYNIHPSVAHEIYRKAKIKYPNLSDARKLSDEEYLKNKFAPPTTDNSKESSTPFKIWNMNGYAVLGIGAIVITGLILVTIYLTTLIMKL